MVGSWGLFGIVSFTRMCVLHAYFASAICNASFCYLSGSTKEGGFFHWLGENGPDVHIGVGCDSCGVKFYVLSFSLHALDACG